MTRPDPLAAQEAREPRGQTVEPVACFECGAPLQAPFCLACTPDRYASPDRVAKLEEALRQNIAREWLASYDDCHRPDYAFAGQMMRDRGKHAGDCPHVDQPAPMTCCGCLVDDAFAFADRALSSTRSEG